MFNWLHAKCEERCRKEKENYQAQLISNTKQDAKTINEKNEEIMNLSKKLRASDELVLKLENDKIVMNSRSNQKENKEEDFSKFHDVISAFVDKKMKLKEKPKAKNSIFPEWMDSGEIKDAPKKNMRVQKQRGKVNK